MSKSSRGAPHPGASGSARGSRARALVTSALVFIVTAITLCTTVGALLWGSLSLFGLDGTPSVIAAIVGIAAVLPGVVWLAVRTYRAEASGALDTPLGLTGSR